MSEYQNAFDQLKRHEKLDRIPKIVISPSDFVNSLPQVPPIDLPDDEHDRKCMICYEDLKASAQDPEDGEQAIRLPCGHILGKECAHAFISRYASVTPTCPLCTATLPRFGTPETNYKLFLLWIARNYREDGAALDRAYQTSGAIHQARALCFSFPRWNNKESGGLDHRYMEALEAMADLDLEDTKSARKVEEMQDGINKLIREYKQYRGRPVPARPSFGQKFRLRGGTKSRTMAKEFEAGAEHGGLSKKLSGALGFSERKVAKMPGWVCRSLNHDFDGVQEQEVAWELQRRRFAYIVSHDMLTKKVICQFAASFSGAEEKMERYARECRMYDAPPRRERHWGCMGSDLLEVLVDEYY